MRRSRQNEALAQENRELRMALIAALAASQDLNRRLVDSQDRVIASKFDAPLVAHPEAQPNNGGLFPPDALSDVLSIEDDREFLERAQ
jgi:hypothetical protein